MTHFASRRTNPFLWITLACLAVAGTAGASTLVEFTPGRTDCALSNDAVVNPYQVATFFTLPGEPLTLSLSGKHPEAHRLEVEAGLLEGNGQAWTWVAPLGPGIYPGILHHPDSGEITTINFVVLVPMEEARGGSLNGYRIGRYPAPMNGREALYQTPAGFIEVTPGNQDTLISPHFRLGQFTSKQSAPFPKYVVLKEGLLIALETILEGVNRSGFEAESLFVMSGFRTPAYNRGLGNVANSRHVFGDAADIFIDRSPADGIMDDLDGNGRSGPGDNRVLARIVEESLPRAGADFVGGMGLYPANSAHGPFVHVDLRGYRARW